MENVLWLEQEINRLAVSMVSVDPWRTSDKVVLSYPTGSFIYDFENVALDLEGCKDDEFSDYIDLYEFLLVHCYGNVGSIFYNPSI